MRVTEHTPPNPYLSHIPERDIETPSGVKLTLLNPAYMLRQIMDDSPNEFGVKGRITSLHPLNPDNAPDDWESEALRAFVSGRGAVAPDAASDRAGTLHEMSCRPGL